MSSLAFTQVPTYDDDLRSYVCALNVKIYILEEAPVTTPKST
jgi:hypothetical protein